LVLPIDRFCLRPPKGEPRLLRQFPSQWLPAVGNRASHCISALPPSNHPSGRRTAAGTPTVHPDLEFQPWNSRLQTRATGRLSCGVGITAATTKPRAQSTCSQEIRPLISFLGFQVWLFWLVWILFRPFLPRRQLCYKARQSHVITYQRK
jgi:hypothetical protein